MRSLVSWSCAAGGQVGGDHWSATVMGMSILRECLGRPRPGRIWNRSSSGTPSNPTEISHESPEKPPLTSEPDGAVSRGHLDNSCSTVSRWPLFTGVATMLQPISHAVIHADSCSPAGAAPAVLKPQLTATSEQCTPPCCRRRS